jgi:hypothetical protein
MPLDDYWTSSLSGHWHCQYGNYAMVNFFPSGGGYLIKAFTKVVIGGSSFVLAPGTVLGDLHHRGGNWYEGKHSMYLLATGAFARWSKLSLTLEMGGRRLSGSIYDQLGVIMITFDRVG